MSKNNGGPAFPCDRIGTEEVFSATGTSIRDYFAAKAMEGMILSTHYIGLIGVNGAQFDYARRAYEMADAMLAEREKS